MALNACLRSHCHAKVLYPAATLTPRQQRNAVARRTLAAAGLMECVTFSFMARADAEQFGPSAGCASIEQSDRCRPGPAFLFRWRHWRWRRSGTPRAAIRMSHCSRPGRLSPSTLRTARGWSRPGFRAGHMPRSWLTPQRPVDAMDAKGDLWSLLTAVGVSLEALQVAVDMSSSLHPSFLHPGRSGTVWHGQDHDGLFWRNASSVAGRARPAGTDGGVRAEPGHGRRSEAAEKIATRPARIPAGAARFRLYRRHWRARRQLSSERQRERSAH